MPSLEHQVLATVVPRIRGGAPVEDEDRFRAEKLAAPAPASRPPRLRGVQVDRLPAPFPVHDLRVRGTDPQRTVLYLHGGGYVEPEDRVHWRYAARLARHVDARVVLPSYPLAPQHTWRDSHDALVRLFEQLAIESPAGVAIAGDSAGGGLALGLARTLVARPGPQPARLLLVSPWVDLTCTVAGTEEAALRDPWLHLSRLRAFGRWWAGGDDVTRPELSPLHGDLTGLPPGLMWCGTRDLLQPQCRHLADRAAEQSWDLRYVEEPGLIHVYPILPVPEARRALAELDDFLAPPWRP